LTPGILGPSSPTKLEKTLSFFFPRLIAGGITVFDDYGWLQFPGAKKAIDHFVNLIDRIHGIFRMLLPVFL